MHSQLRIVKGVQGAPGDVQTLENGYTVLNLLMGGAEGFSLKSDTGAWNPAIAQPKNGLWSETAFTDGRQLFAGAEQNVTETLSLTLSAPDMVRLGNWMRQLNQMQADALRFWEDEHIQFDPVFLWWQATGAPGPQYALIYQIQISINIPTTQDSNIIERDVTITLEREPYWRGIPPGANPVLWTLYKLGEQPGLNYNFESGELTLSSAGNFPIQTALATANLQNRAEADINALVGATRTTFRSQNWLTIPADKIPGDAPALLQLNFAVTSALETLAKAFVAVRSGPIAKETSSLDSANFLYFNVLPIIGGVENSAMVTPPTLAADSGGVQGYSYWDNTTYNISQRGVITPTTSEETAVTFTSNKALHGMLQRGRFAVFMRCRQNGGSLGDIQVRLAVEDGAYPVTDWVSMPLQAGAGNTTAWEVAYLGQLEFPIDVELPMSQYSLTTYKRGGTGIETLVRTFDLALNVIRHTGVGVLYVADLIFMPLDEGFVDVLISRDDNANLFIDNTGYMRHGKPGTYATNGTQDQKGYCELQGSELLLQPNIDNHIFFIYRDGNNDSRVRTAFTVHANIVPRWRYIRDV